MLRGSCRNSWTAENPFGNSFRTSRLPRGWKRRKGGTYPPAVYRNGCDAAACLRDPEKIEDPPVSKFRGIRPNFVDSNLNVSLKRKRNRTGFVRSSFIHRRLTLSERMPPYSRHYKYSKKIECRHTGGKKKIPDFCSNCKSKFPTFAGIKTRKLPFS